MNVRYRIALIILIALAAFLRLYKLAENPPGFYSDEASYAYNAYSILRTGHDEHGSFLPLTAEAFGDYKLPVMLYSIVGSFALFGPSDWAARLPGALYGIGSILLVYFLIKEIENKNSNKLALAAVALLAITPSHIFVSRGTWELTPALFFILFGTFLFIKGVKHKTNSFLFYLGSALSFVLAVYAYNSARVFVPLYGIFLLTLYYKPIHTYIKKRVHLLQFFAVGAVMILLCLPILKSIRTPEVTQRAKYISIFYDKGVESRLFDAIRSDSGQPVRLTQVLHNKPLFYAMDFSKRYLSHFDFNFLFVIGDTFEIFQIYGVGFLPLLSLPLLLIGAFLLIKNRPDWFWLMVGWLLISPIASSFTIFTPSLSRAQNLVIPLTIISAYGLCGVYEYVENNFNTRRIFFFVIGVLFLLNTAYIFHQYFIITPSLLAEKWNDGFKNQVAYAQANQDNYDKIVISSSKAPAYIFYAWYAKWDPVTFQRESVVDHTPDQNGLNFTSQFKKYYFTKNIAEQQKIKQSNQNILFIGFKDELTSPSIIFTDRNGKPIGESAE